MMHALKDYHLSIWKERPRMSGFNQTGGSIGGGGSGNFQKAGGSTGFNKTAGLTPE
jgi:hypothetical protein